MFTGIIEEVGSVQKSSPVGKSLRFRIAAHRITQELNINDSVSINGACHTVVSRGATWFDVDSVEETIRKTTMGRLTAGDAVNLELSVRLHDRLGGHLVLGHVDTVGEIAGIERRSASWLVTIRCGLEFMKYVIPVGSIAIDGVSLTIAEYTDNVLGISVIPHTMQNTIFPHYKPGRSVNIEYDVVGKYIERFLAYGGTRPSSAPFPSEERLRILGF
jgi:riboflavin synthase